MSVAETKVAIAGLGSIGTSVVIAFVQGCVPGYRLVAVAASNPESGRAKLEGIGSDAALCPLDRLAEASDIIIECLPASMFSAVADPVVGAGKILVPLTASALLDRMDLIDRAKETGARILVPSGALPGFDALRAAAEGEIQTVRIVTRKPPGSLAGAPQIKAAGIRLDGLGAPLCVFSGSAQLGVKGFSANVNVAAALSLAGIGPDDAGDLGRSNGHQEYPPHRGEGGRCPVLNKDREYAVVRKSPNRSVYATQCAGPASWYERRIPRR